MHERSLWVAHNVEESVDEVLAGGRPIVQMRTREERTGAVRVDQAAYDMDVILAQNSIAHTLGSMGRIVGTTSSVDDVYFGGSTEFANSVSSRPRISDGSAAAASKGAGSTSSAPAPPSMGGGKGAAPAHDEDPTRGRRRSGWFRIRTRSRRWARAGTSRAGRWAASTRATG